MKGGCLGDGGAQNGNGQRLEAYYFDGCSWTTSRSLLKALALSKAYAGKIVNAVNSFSEALESSMVMV